jgi:hypothetical protein
MGRRRALTVVLLFSLLTLAHAMDHDEAMVTTGERAHREKFRSGPSPFSLSLV